MTLFTAVTSKWRLTKDTHTHTAQRSSVAHKISALDVRWNSFTSFGRQLILHNSALMFPLFTQFSRISFIIYFQRQIRQCFTIRQWSVKLLWAFYRCVNRLSFATLMSWFEIFIRTNSRPDYDTMRSRNAFYVHSNVAENKKINVKTEKKRNTV